MKLQTWDMKDKLVRATKGLGDHPEWKQVSITPDLTKEQQKEDYELKQELKRKKGNRDIGNWKEEHCDYHNGDYNRMRRYIE